MKEKRRCAAITVRGRVQGVFFRAEAKRKADELQLTGFVENLPNGDVFLVAAGPEKTVRSFIAWCSKGQRGLATIQEVTVQWRPEEKEFLDFQIR